jgi:serine/threonine protein phosphatase 1
MSDAAADGPAHEEARNQRVPADSLVYAVGDVHGRLDLLERLHDIIEADAAGIPAARKIVVYLGDYVDRGPDSRRVVDLLIEEPLADIDAVHLMGNHEALLLSFLVDPGQVRLWFMNGGDATLRSYGVDLWAETGADGRADYLRQAFIDRLPDSHLEFYRALALTHQEGDYMFVHAGIRPGIPLEAQDPEDLIWIRQAFLDSMADHGKVIVHGHTPAHEAQLRPNRIGIDTGAVYGGKLTVLVLHGAEQRLLQV